MTKKSAGAPLSLLALGAILLNGCATQNTTATTAAPVTVAVTKQAAAPTTMAATTTAAATTALTAVPVSTEPPSPPAATATAVSTEQPVAPETNPAGDIPDTQVFVSFTSQNGGYTLQVPEGWARTTSDADVRFVNKLDGVQVTVTDAATAPTAASARTNEVAMLEKTGRAVQVNKVQDVRLPAGTAVLVDYSSNSEPDTVTGKQLRLENNAYLFFKGGKLATLTLWAPQGADNVDQWQQMVRSFRWQ